MSEINLDDDDDDDDKHKRQPIGMLGRSSGNHDWLLANSSDCVWMETGLKRAS